MSDQQNHETRIASLENWHASHDLKCTARLEAVRADLRQQNIMRLIYLVITILVIVATKATDPALIAQMVRSIMN